MSNIEQHTPLSEILRVARAGAHDERLSAELADICQAVLESGKKGSLTVTFSVEPDGETAVSIDVKHKTTKPIPSIGSMVFYLAANGRLERTDPRQVEMFSVGPRMIRDEDKEKAAVSAA